MTITPPSRQDVVAPNFLKHYNQWITWRHVTRPGTDKPTKVPLASTTDPSTWTDFDTALAAWSIDPTISGVGFVFSENDPFAFLDIDGCGEPGAWQPHAAAAHAALAGAVWETSQSGSGLHAIARVNDKSAFAERRNVWRDDEGNKFEFYTQERFMALGRGEWRDDTPQDATQALLTFVPQRDAPRADKSTPLSSGPREGYTGPTDDDELIKRALASQGSKNAAFGQAATFRQLWEADEEALGGFYPDPNDARRFDHSSADAALMNHLAFWTGCDAERMQRLFSRSALGARDKWRERDDYRHATISKAANEPDRNYYTTPAAPQRDPVEVPEGETPNATLARYAASIPDKNDHAFMIRMMMEAECEVRFCEFRRVITIDGEPISDAAEIALWFKCCDLSGLHLPKAKFQDALRHYADLQQYHPVRDYLDTAQPTWDGKSRVDTWLIDHAGAHDTPYIRAVSAATLIAAVRRIRRPGCKHDEMLVLEGAQGVGKSTVFEALCPDPEWFTDAVNVAMDSKQLMEVTAGKWFVEAPELSRMSGAEVEHVKSLLSRNRDSARMSYDRHVTMSRRQFVMVGTTNSEQYLIDETGNRRFWPVGVTTVDVEGVAKARDQLWAEAAVREAAGESNGLAPELWAAAGDEQRARMLHNPYKAALGGKLADLTGSVTLTTLQDALEIKLRDRRATHRSITSAMTDLGWTYCRKTSRFIKGDPVRELTSLGGTISAKPASLRITS